MLVPVSFDEKVDMTLLPDSSICTATRIELLRNAVAAGG